jgi:MFS transporter, DHA1 family, multidrug resistance protein
VSSEQPTRRALVVALGPVYLSVFLFMGGNAALTVLVPVYLAQDARLGPAQIGLVVGALSVAALAARLPTGLAYSASRGRGLLLAGGLCSAASFALIPLAHSPLALAGLMALNGLGWSVATTVQLALLVARPPAGISTRAAMGYFAGAASIGNIAAILGGVTGDLIGLRPTFWLFAGTPLLAALLMASRIGSVVARQAPQEQRPRVPLRQLVRMPLAVWAGVLVMFFINGLNAIVNAFHPVLARQAGLSLTQIGALSSVRSWASASTRLGSGPIFQRFDAAGLTLPLVVIGALATCFIPSVIAVFLLQIPLFLLMGLSRGLLRVTGSADAFDAVADDERGHGVVSALLYAGLDLGKIVAPVVGGIVADVWGYPAMFRVVPLGLVLLYLALAIPARRALSRAPAARESEA